MSYWNRFGSMALRGPFNLKMRILITGGMGFVGGRLAVHLALLGHQIVIGTRNVAATPDWLPQAQVVQTIWTDDLALEHCCNGVDVLIHAAAMNSQDCIADPVSALEFNGVATARLTAAASRASVRKFIYLSTAHVYASQLAGTITEESFTSNLHPYATSHLAGENAVLGASENSQLDGTVLRLSNVFGPPVHKDANCWILMVNELCKQAIQTKKMVLRTSGIQQRDFIAMTNVCSIVEQFVNNNSRFLMSGIFNIGSGNTLSIFEMARLIQNRCKQLIGFEPILEKNEKCDVKTNQNLVYRPDKFAKFGFKINYENSMEIDSLLKFCSTAFSQNKVVRTNK